MNKELFDKYLADAGYGREDAAGLLGIALEELEAKIEADSLTPKEMDSLARMMGIAMNCEALEEVFFGRSI